jgi:putative methionine-R-sulfoxide reductase with GAF domain
LTCSYSHSTKGLTGAAIPARKTVNVGDVTADPRYLTAFGTTRSEMMVPVLDGAGENAAGTMEVESEKPNAKRISGRGADAS